MKFNRLIYLSIIAFFPFIGLAQTAYDSNKQSFLKEKNGYEFFDQEDERKIMLYNDSIVIELFNGVTVCSKIKFEQDQIDKNGNSGKRYSVNNYENGLIVFYDKKIFINFGIAYGIGTYYLSNSNHTFLTEQAKKNKAEELDYQTTKELYGKLTADCKREKRICIGMHWMGVFDVLGEPSKQDYIESTNVKSIVLTYNTITIYCEMDDKGIWVTKTHYH